MLAGHAKLLGKIQKNIPLIRLQFSFHHRNSKQRPDGIIQVALEQIELALEKFFILNRLIHHGVE